MAAVSRVRFGVAGGAAWWPHGPGARQLEAAAAALTIALLMMMAAALPDDRNEARVRGAASPVSTAASPGRETNFGAYLGAPYHYPSDFRFVKQGQTDLTIKDIHWYTEPFKNPLYYGVRIQRWFEGGRFGTMLDFVHSKVFAPKDEERVFEGTINGQPAPAKAKPGDYFNKLEWTHGHNMLTLNGLMRFASFGIVSPYAGLGAGITLPHSEIHLKTDPARTYEYQYAGPTAQVIFGLEFRLQKSSVFVEYKFTFADYWAPITHTDGSWLPFDMWRQFSRWWRGEEPPGGWHGARLASHQVVGGFLTRFVPATALRRR
jgi:lipid A oxidase